MANTLVHPGTINFKLSNSDEVCNIASLWLIIVPLKLKQVDESYFDVTMSWLFSSLKCKTC